MGCDLWIGEGTLVLRMSFPKEHFIHWLCNDELHSSGQEDAEK